MPNFPMVSFDLRAIFRVILIILSLFLSLEKLFSVESPLLRQDIWVDELNETSARVSLLFRKPVECAARHVDACFVSF